MPEFEYTQEYLQNLAKQIVDRAISLGATAAEIELNHSISTNVDVLNQEIENFETSYGCESALTVYLGKQKGHVSVTKLPPVDLDQLIRQALDIAKYTQEDAANGLADKAWLCEGINQDLKLYNPSNIDNLALVEYTKEIEALALQSSDKIKASEGSSVNLVKTNFVYANSLGFDLGYPTTRASNSVSLIGSNQAGMQTDYWYSSERDFNDLLSPQELAITAANRLIRRLNKGKIKSGKYSVIFEAPIAKTLIGTFLGAISGGNLYRKLSFLNDSINTQVFPQFVNIIEDPFVIKGSSSCYFDAEGVKVSSRNLVENGILQGYLLNSYCARKLGLTTTGNAGGNHNILVNSNFSGSVLDLAKQLSRGLIIIETIGHGVNLVTGDYSVGASGLWVENGEVQFFVDNLSISYNLKDLFKEIAYIGNDYTKSSVNVGSILVPQINVSA